MNLKLIAVSLSTTTVVLAGLALLLPNALWLRHSTLRVTNVGQTPVQATEVQVGSKTLKIQAVQPDRFKFEMLPTEAQGSMLVTVTPRSGLHSFCHTYLEPKMYHVEIQIQDGQVVNCQTSLPLLSKLWVVEAFL
ncbi:hypothetical protein [Lyngbya confervoides]|uniref:EfeO-type cupredoxin-like domain-containing protein n=1 Tax=Lyngbya confervoides BDU141951 TaxID=1574623 RepID=A0ABD4T976_9CYAN|nr:hypothetical protein [Lyngbya confervoides]MCM1985166.1 hypothetical protein [Lyngbya confervoides BDU141951]